MRLSPCWRGGLVCTFLALWTLPAFAQREVRIRTLPETPLPFVTTVVSPAARYAAVNDVSGILAVAHRPKQPAHISLYRLDPQGQIVPGDPLTIQLPKAAALGERPNHVTGLVCHPRLPLLYVWQDVEPNPASDPPIDPALAVEFDHLLIYSLEEPQPKLLLAAARGADFSIGNASGGFALNAAATRLYVPNMQQTDRLKKVTACIGWLTLDADGLPAFARPDEKPDDLAAAPAKPTTLDPSAAAAARSTKLALLEQSKAAGQPLVMRKHLEPSVSFSYPPAPYSYAPVDDDTVMLAGHSGPASWSLADRLGRICSFYVPPYIAYRYRVIVHPAAPAVYVSKTAYDGHLSMLEHAEGHFTLVPQTAWLDNQVIYHPGIVLVKRNQLALGAAGRLCLVDLDERGRFKPSGIQMTVPNPTVEALAWSDKFERLYVPVEKTP